VNGQQDWTNGSGFGKFLNHFKLLDHGRFMSHNNGITLLEILITLAIVSILATLGLPSLYSLINNNRLTTVTNQMLGAFYLTRSEAIKRNQRVTMAAKHGDWKNGWQIFVDADADAVIDPGQRIIFDHPPLHDSISISGNVAHVDSYISYLSSGFSRTLNGALQIGTLTLCSSSARSGVPSRSLIVNYSGRWRARVNDGASCN